MRVRAKRVTISPDALFAVMQANSSWKVSKGIPRSARIRGLTIDPYSQILNLFIEDDSFEEVEIGDIIPILLTEFKKI